METKTTQENSEACAGLAAATGSASCHDCARPYGHEHGFPDLIIPYWAWKQISPSGDDGGLLCPSCICKRLDAAGISCEGAFMSGPIISVSGPTMNTLRRVENIELAIEGRNNAWSGVRELIMKTPTTTPDKTDAMPALAPVSFVRWLLRKLVIALERNCKYFHWIPGWRCKLANWSSAIDEKYNLGEWQVVERNEPPNAPGERSER
jgi:hypothetical protein